TTRLTQSARQRRHSKTKKGRGAQKVQPRLLPRSQQCVGVRSLQEDLLERQRFEETPRKTNLKCKLLQATETIEKFKLSG
ncbi:MAG: hypothetical protein ACKPKO_43530, partial [Candidatus Fonsibacter sp.]